MRRRAPRRAGRLGRIAALVGLMLAPVTGCGEPAIDIELPARAEGQHVLDLAGILDGDPLQDRLAGLDLDIVALTYETAQASCGEAFRAGEELVAAWDADIAVVAVARPGDFTSTADERERCLGLTAADERFAGAAREEIAEQLVPPFADDNDWQAAVEVAVDRLVGATGASSDDCVHLVDKSVRAATASSHSSDDCAQQVVRSVRAGGVT